MTIAPPVTASARRPIFGTDHDAFRESVRGFLAREAVPHTEAWEEAGMVPRAFWSKAATQGLVGWEVPEEYGGAGIRDFRFNAVLNEEMSYAGAVGDNFSLQNDILVPYLLELATDDQKQRWLPPFVAGDLLFAIAMSEPEMGSDLRAMTTSATRAGGGWLVNGSKTFVTSGIQADMVIVAARPSDAERRGQLNLLVVEGGMEGFKRGRKLKKIGRLAQDTAELFFDDVFVPDANLLGEERRGLDHLKVHLPQERMSQAVVAVAVAEAALDLTVAYCRERRAFGKPIGEHQAIRFALAEMRNEVDVSRAYIDRCIERHV
ncbi:MAG TPA: acyl-CoA dehydrogenase family protein, partial [Solirubrobacteraceae bacterium]|nr:acyl-CoA dehydrogenase family protein [Solirubrobacteraceae bacterium]